VPAYDLRAFAGPVGDLRAAEPLERLRPPPGRRLRLDGLFLARATGHSMEPSVPHGSWCLLRQPPAPPLLGKVVLVQHGGPDASDGVGGWQIKRVTRLDWSPDGIDVRLSGDNPEAAPVDLHILSEDGLVVAGELVEVAAAPDADPTPR
jgi:phage repressor protein C with HTH and peptisase S24 domain